MTIDLYYLPVSGPCRAVLMVAKAANVKLNLKYVDLMKGEHLTPEFLKLNPQHTIPVLVDEYLTIWESHVILSYLVENYSYNEDLYPKSARERALVNQRLFFNIDYLFRAFKAYYSAKFRNEPTDPEKFKVIESVFETLEQFLERNRYIAGAIITIADYAVVSTVSSYEAVGFNVAKYVNTQKWYTAMQTAPGYEENLEGYNVLKAMASHW